MWHTSTGKIIYDPYRGGMKRRTKWWCVVEVDTEITRYYRSVIKQRYHLHSLIQPAWDAHISVIRGEKPAPELQHLWNKYHGQTVEFSYWHYPRRTDIKPNRLSDDAFWTLKIECPFLMNIRKEFNMPTHWNLHLSVGKEKY